MSQSPQKSVGRILHQTFKNATKPVWIIFSIQVMVLVIVAILQLQPLVTNSSETLLAQTKPKLIEYVKSTMFFPDTFEFVSIGCNPPSALDDYSEVGMRYHATNVLGQVVPNFILVHADHDGNILKVVRE